MPSLQDFVTELQQSSKTRYLKEPSLPDRSLMSKRPAPTPVIMPKEPRETLLSKALPFLSMGGAVSATGPRGGGSTSYSFANTSGALDPNSQLLRTVKGVTLQKGALRSLIDIARRSDVLPGTQELRNISDSYRSYAEQAAAYASKPGLAAPPGQSYHGKGLAIDASWWSSNPQLAKMLAAAGWNRFSPSTEPWHWSYGVTG